jgi:hypothetical protein
LVRPVTKLIKLGLGKLGLIKLGLGKLGLGKQTPLSRRERRRMRGCPATTATWHQVLSAG